MKTKYKYMKTIFILLIILLSSTIAKAQDIFVVQYKEEAQVIVCVVKDTIHADLVVYIDGHAIEGEENDGIWYMVGHRSQGRKLIYFTQHLSDCDLKIYFTDKKTEARWRHNSKKHLLE